MSNFNHIIGKLTEDQTADLARECLHNIGDIETIQLIREMCLEDEDFCNELIADIEGLAT